MLSEYDIDAIQKYLRDFKQYLRELHRFEAKYGHLPNAKRNPFWMFECKPYDRSKRRQYEILRRELDTLIKQSNKEDQKTKDHDISLFFTPSKTSAKDKQKDEERKDEDVYVVRETQTETPSVVNDISPYTHSESDASSYSEDVEEDVTEPSAVAKRLQKLIDDAEKKGTYRSDREKGEEQVMVSPVAKSQVVLTPLEDIADLRRKRAQEMRRRMEESIASGNTDEEVRLFAERQERRRKMAELKMDESIKLLDRLVTDIQHQDKSNKE
jgi:hypothetical protein